MARKRTSNTSTRHISAPDSMHYWYQLRHPGQEDTYKNYLTVIRRAYHNFQLLLLDGVINSHEQPRSKTPKPEHIRAWRLFLGNIATVAHD